MLYQPLLSEHEKTRQRWYFGLFVLTLLWGGAFVYQNKHEIGEALAVGAPEDAVGSAAMYGYIHETPVGSNDVSKIEAEMNREGSKCGFTSVFKALPDGAAAEAAAEVFWANMVKAREAYKTGTVPDWKTILPTADIKPYLTGSGFPDVATGKAESPRTVLMLWSGDYTFNHAWRAMQQAYRLETTTLGYALGKAVGNEFYKRNENDGPYKAFIGTLYDRISEVFSGEFGGTKMIAAVSKSLSEPDFLGKTLSMKEFPAIMDNASVESLEIWMREKDGSYSDKADFIFEKATGPWTVLDFRAKCVQLLKGNSPTTATEHDPKYANTQPDPKPTTCGGTK